MNNTPRYSELSDEDLRLVHEISEQFERDLGDGRSVEIADLIANAPATIRQFLFSELVEIKLNFPGDNSKLNADELIAQFPEFQAEIDSILEQDSEREKTKLPESLGSGSRLAGQYDLIEQIGEGGMGEVWKANQTRPVQRFVAIKLIKTGMDSQAVVARFEHERQSLAIMDHPNIARVFDAGISRVGQPFFVMEYVDGVPLNRFCDNARLTPRQRLELFVPICQAVQHAHQKGIVHRDLKPSNIIVRMIDEKPVPTVIDFGVAKATAANTAVRSFETQLGTIVGTLAYMSPEQAGLAEKDIDTRSDIYSLGVILYELLTGLRPIETQELESVGLAEMVRVIQEEEPSRPSTKLSSSHNLPSLAELRSIEPRRLPAMLRGELDWVVMKCLEKSRDRRYETANELARDVERYLANEPVEARPPSNSYRLAKFIRRNRLAVASAATVLLLLLAGIGGTTYGLILADKARLKAVGAQLAESHRAEGERAAKLEARKQTTIAVRSAEKEKAANAKAQKRLQQIEKSSQILGSIFKSLRPEEIAESKRPLQAILVEKLDLAVEQLESDSIGDPLVVADMQSQLGQSLLALSEPKKAVVLFQKAFDARKSLLGEDALLTIASAYDLGNGFLNNGDIDQAIELFESAISRQHASLDAEHPSIAFGQTNLAHAYIAAGKLDKALPLMRESVERHTKSLGPDDPKTLTAISTLASIYHDMGKPTRAMKLFKTSYEQLTKLKGQDHPQTLLSMHNLAGSFLAVGNVDKAQSLYEDAFVRMSSTFGKNHATTLLTMGRLASLYKELGELDRAIPLLQRTLKLTKTELGPEHPDTLLCMSNLASGYQASGDTKRALDLFNQTHKLTERTLGTEHPNTILSVNNLAMSYQTDGQHEVALPLFMKSLSGLKKKFEPNHPATLTCTSNLATLYQDLGTIELAIPLFEDALEIQRSTLGEAHPDALRTMNNLAVAYWSTDQLDKSIPLFETLVEGTTKLFGRTHPNTLMTVVNLGVNLKDNNRVEAALPLLEEAYQATGNYAGLLQLAGPQLLDGYALAGMQDKTSELAKEIVESTRTQLPESSRELADFLSNIAFILMKANLFTDCKPLLSESLYVYEQEDPESWRTYRIQAMQGAVLLGQKKASAALPLLVTSYEGMKVHADKIPDRTKYGLADAQASLVKCHELIGDQEHADKIRAEPID